MATTSNNNNNKNNNEMLNIVILYTIFFAFQKLQKPDYSENPPANSPQSPDSSSEVLAALSPEERELLKAITGKGYPLQTAIIALQKAGHQTSDQVFLVASAEAFIKTSTLNHWCSPWLCFGPTSCSIYIYVFIFSLLCG